jgi:AraC-like DNA-binding protein
MNSAAVPAGARPARPVTSNPEEYRTETVGHALWHRMLERSCVMAGTLYPDGEVEHVMAIDPRIAFVIERMEQTLARADSLPELAAHVDLSVSHMARLFREETGISPARYLHHLRMERARLLIERTFLSVKEVMACVGFSDPGHFARDFRRHHGITPTRLSQQSWAADATRPPHRKPPTAAANGHGRDLRRPQTRPLSSEGWRQHLIK